MVIHGPSRLRGPITQREKNWDESARPTVMPTLYDPPMRTELIARIKGEIAAGTYDTPERFETAFMAMLEQERE